MVNDNRIYVISIEIKLSALASLALWIEHWAMD